MGGWHGILRVLCHSKQSTNKQHARIWNIVNSMFTFLGVMFGFVFFRASSLEISFIYIKRMFSNLSFSLSDIIESILPFTMDYTCVAYFIVICFFIIVLGIKEFMEAPKNEKMGGVREEMDIFLRRFYNFIRNVWREKLRICAVLKK